MTEITGSDMDLNVPNQFGGSFQLGGNLVSTQSLGTFGSAGLANFEGASGFGSGGDAQFAASSYESYGQQGAADLGLAGGVQSFESYSYDSSGGALGGIEGAQFGAGEEAIGGFASNASYYGGAGGAGFGAMEGAGALMEAGGSSAEFSASSAAYGAGGGFGAGFGAGAGAGAGAVLPLNAYKIQVDSSPTVIRRQMAGAATVHRQNIVVRFLRPPAPPAPGPLIIKEIRPPQPRPAPPLIIRQRPPRPRTPPPLVLRERPPRMPVVTKTQTVIKRLAVLPAPPRQVIIERYPALPAKPRDVIIERWLQYGPLPKRRVIYQRAAAVRAYRTPKNVIIQYSAPRPSVQRVFRRLGIVSMSPSSYLSQYGATLLDAHSISSAARSAGVVESIAPPSLVYPIGVAVGGAAMGSAAAGSFYSASEEQTVAGGLIGSDSSALALLGGESSSAYASYGGVEQAGGVDMSSSSVGFGGYSVGGAEAFGGESSAAYSSSAEFEGGAALGGYEYSSATETVEGANAGMGAAESYESTSFTSTTTNEA